MTDVVKNEPLRILVGPKGGTLLWLPYAQLDQVRALLDLHKVAYWWNEWVYGTEGKNPVTSISLSLNEDPNRVQALLDATP
ncbi:hypothetical protein VT84_37410 [Gemmata sp. SH-PL17]|uniref:hypothetical protein n=1 Tax=Gemmata sp. SH-PL17 TaxID=1630693 RepID=UPI0004B18473|nr:hypothetical protein [Gemmata sp. SH-PL17]AMV30132.1 hypothetical protein VT84_37410 [Gemmata sp. SH-PL17]